MAEPGRDLAAALAEGDPDRVAALIAAGVDVRYKRDHGYDALLDAVHGRDIARDPRLLDLLSVLVAHGVDLDGVSSYEESALRVLSRVGRFDAVRLLLSAGADRSQLEWTPLIEAVALGTLADVERLAEGAALEETDWWSRTPWLVAVLAGDLAKARLLRDRGANVDARGRCGTPPLSYAVEGRHPEMVRWLLDIGLDVEQADDFGATPLMAAVECQDLACVRILVAAGANADRETPAGSILGAAATKEIALALLAAGANPSRLSHDGLRALCGLAGGEELLSGVSEKEFRRARTRAFGTANPDRMREPFWDAMVRSGLSGYHAAQRFGADHDGSPVWSAMRFGQSITLLPDGRVVQIGGEHEDHYDPDFCIYNDVFVHGPDGSLAIYGYPEAAFPPTDFHTATLVDEDIVVIGSLGYSGARRYGHTPVHRLHTGTLRMERLTTTGDMPGWIYEHRAARVSRNEIRVWGGKIVTAEGGEEIHGENAGAFVLDLERLVWRREAGTLAYQLEGL